MDTWRTQGSVPKKCLLVLVWRFRLKIHFSTSDHCEREVADPGFAGWGCPTHRGTSPLISPKTAWKWRNLDRDRMPTPEPLLNPPLWGLLGQDGSFWEIQRNHLLQAWLITVKMKLRFWGHDSKIAPGAKLCGIFTHSFTKIVYSSLRTQFEKILEINVHPLYKSETDGDMFLATPAFFYKLLSARNEEQKADTLRIPLMLSCLLFYSAAFDTTTTKRFKSGETCINKSLCVGNQAHHNSEWRKNPLAVQCGAWD